MTRDSFLDVDCDEEHCTFEQIGPAQTTLVYYPPRYNKKGENLNPDRNTATSRYRCAKCGKEVE